MFGLSFLTTLNIYKNYFKGWKGEKVAQEHNSTSVKKSVIENLVCPILEEAVVFVHYRVLWPSNFMILIV